MLDIKALDRRVFLRTVLGGTAVLALTACGAAQRDWYGTGVTGTLPDMSFSMTRAADMQSVGAADYRGQVVALFFGYTFCPDVCPMTLANLTAVAEVLGAQAKQFTVLFVTVDPERDTPTQLAAYVDNFTSRAEGLIGTDNQLARLTRRLRVTIKIADHAPGATDYAVSHGKSVYIFDQEGKARVLWPTFDTLAADIDGAASDVSTIISDS